MGKDNVPFHTVIFPATLLGTGEKWTMMRNIRCVGGIHTSGVGGSIRCVRMHQVWEGPPLSSLPGKSNILYPLVIPTLVTDPPTSLQCDRVPEL